MTATFMSGNNTLPLYTDMQSYVINNKTNQAVSKTTGKVLSAEELKALIEGTGSETATP